MDSENCLTAVPESCDALTLQTDEEINQCIKSTVVPEVTEGQCEYHAYHFVLVELPIEFHGTIRLGETPWMQSPSGWARACNRHSEL